MSSSPISVQPQTLQSARFASFARHCSYGYASSRKLTNRTRQQSFHLTDGDMR